MQRRYLRNALFACLTIGLFSAPVAWGEFCKFNKPLATSNYISWIDVQNGEIVCRHCDGKMENSIPKCTGPMEMAGPSSCQLQCSEKFSKFEQKITDSKCPPGKINFNKITDPLPSCQQDKVANGNQKNQAPNANANHSKTQKVNNPTLPAAKQEQTGAGQTPVVTASPTPKAPVTTEAPPAKTAAVTNTNSKPNDPISQEEMNAANSNGNGTAVLKDADGKTYEVSNIGNGKYVKTYTESGQTFDQKGRETTVDLNGEYFTTSDGKRFSNREEWNRYRTDKGVAGEVHNTKTGNTVIYDKDGRPAKLVDKNGKTLNQRTAETSDKKVDECEYSQQIDQRFTCNPTHAIAKTTDVSNQVLTTAGRMVVTQMGAVAAQKARDGTFAGTQDAAAKMARTTSTYETVLGVANIGAAAALASKAKKHKNNIGELRNLKGADVQTLDANAAGSNRNYDKAIGEQQYAKNVAEVAAYKATMVAAQAMAGAIAAKKMQKDAEANANLARKNEKLIRDNTFSYDPSRLNLPGSSNAYDQNGMPITGVSETNSNSSSTNSDNSDENLDGTGPLLGDGADTGANSGDVAPIPGGTFRAGGAGGGGAGGGGGGVAAGGGGGGSGPAPAVEESKAAYASDFGTKERYESGNGNTGAGGRGGRGGAGGKDEGGIDLNGLLAQFLPKGEEDLGSKNGILDPIEIQRQTRAIASEEPASYLDKNADLFQRIHETMSELNRKGRLGI